MTELTWQTRIFAFATAALIAGSSPGLGQELGDARRGLAVASRVCAECHAVQADKAESPLSKATPFAVFAQVPGLTELALVAFLQTSHKDMPNFILPRQEQDDIIAYIMSLRRKP